MNLNYIENKIVSNYTNSNIFFLRKIRSYFMKFRNVFMPKDCDQIDNLVFVIGAQKGGTTSLYNYLIQNSQVCSSVFKETNFYGLNRRKKSHKRFRLNYPYKTAGNVCIDATPDYLSHPLACRRIKNDYPNAKFILLLREPISRLISQFNMEKSRFENVEDRKIGKAVQEDFIEFNKLISENEFSLDKDNSLRSEYIHRGYIYRGLYANHIEKWLKYFDRSQFYFGFSEDLKNNTKYELEKICEFIGIEYENVDLKFKHTKKYSDSVKIDDSTSIFLKEIFKEPNDRLFKTLGISSRW